MSEVGKQIIDGLTDFADQLHAAGGDIDKTDLRVTRFDPCWRCGGHGQSLDWLEAEIVACPACNGRGVIRVVTIGGEPC